MRINAATTQSELRALYTKLSRDEFLRDTPLNLRMFLRYALLFILFPGMILGFRAGLIIMTIFCSGMAAIMLAGKYGIAYSAAICWLLFGAVVFLWVVGSTLIAAFKRFSERRTPRPADVPLSPSDSKQISSGDTRDLLWTSDNFSQLFSARLELRASRSGLWVIMLELHHCGHARLILPEHRGLYPLHSTSQDQELRSFILCLLEPGIHHIPWLLISDCPHPPQTTVSILCTPPQC